MNNSYPVREILKDIPAPVHHGKQGRTAKFRLLEVGECIFFKTIKEAASFITSQRYQLGKLGINTMSGMYVRETANGQTGVWRIK
tara:strand:- start:22444 stop:22698 length:255 start_codon:yes stop_codon:yes gene_type:complete